MTVARSEVVIDGVEMVYHVVSRCVRRAFLCGVDHYSSKSYEHRKEWVRSRHLLYVACTRARDHHLVISVDPASEFLDDMVMK